MGTYLEIFLHVRYESSVYDKKKNYEMLKQLVGNIPRNISIEIYLDVKYEGMCEHMCDKKITGS